MSSQKGNSSKQKKPAHQNKFAFKHNKNSKKTQEILNIPTEGLCQHCHDVIEWKKKYRKYKPITSPTKCVHCEQKRVTRAYHILCVYCAKELKACAKCKEQKEIVVVFKTPEEKREEERLFKDAMARLNERQRRTILRLMEKDSTEAMNRLFSQFRIEEESDSEEEVGEKDTKVTIIEKKDNLEEENVQISDDEDEESEDEENEDEENEENNEDKIEHKTETTETTENENNPDFNKGKKL